MRYCLLAEPVTQSSLTQISAAELVSEYESEGEWKAVTEVEWQRGWTG